MNLLSISSLIPPQFRAYIPVAKLLIVAAAIAAVAVFSYSAGGRHMRLVYEAKLAKIEYLHAEELANRQAEHIKAADKYEKDTSEVEIEYYNALSEINALKSRPVVINRLYDPGAKRPTCGSTTGDTRGAPGISGDGSGNDGSELSEEAGRFLQEEADRADTEIKKCNVFRKKAHDWAVKSRD